MTRDEFFNEVDVLTSEKNDRWIMAICALVLFGLILSLSGCAARNAKAPTTASVNQSITTAIADAGAVANQAKQEYESGQLPQTAAVRTAINDLGTAYNDASAAYVEELRARAAFQSAQIQQIAACKPSTTPVATPPANGVTPTPPAGNATLAAPAAPSADCQSLTVTANATKLAATNASTQLSQKISALTTKTSTVKAIATPKK